MAIYYKKFNMQDSKYGKVKCNIALPETGEDLQRLLPPLEGQGISMARKVVYLPFAYVVDDCDLAS